jgi:ABC-2 type transport system ATP-binding protein
VLHVNYEEGQGASASDIPNVLINGGYRLTKFAEEPINLETAFMRLTKGLVQ